MFALFWGAAIVFVLAMARHLRVFAAARAAGPSPFDNIPARLAGLIEYAFVQTKMFKDPGAAILHLGIFWGFILLTVGTANIVTGGLVQAVISWPFDGILWAATLAMQNVVAVIVIACVLWAFWRRFVTRPPRLTYNRDALVILGMIGGVVATELFAMVFEVAAFGEQPGAFIANALGAPLTLSGTFGFDEATLETAFWVLWWAHMALVAAFLVYLPFSKHLHIATSFFNIYFRKLAPRGELPAMDLEAGRRDVRAADARGPRLERPPRRLHVHRVRPLPAGLPRLDHGQATQPQALHHGHPGHVGRGRARPPADPELALGGVVRPDRRRSTRRRCWPRSSTTRSRTTPSGTA